MNPFTVHNFQRVSSKILYFKVICYIVKFIISCGFVDDVATPWDDYDQPWILKYEDYENGNWIATRRPTHWAKPVVESYTMTAEGGRENYKCVVLGEVA